MKLFKKVLALLLVTVLLLSFSACHKKDEIAIKVGDTSFTSAFYMCSLLNADNEARTKVQQSLSEEGSDTTDIDYASQEIDGKDYTTWVKDKALEICKNFGVALNKCKELGIEISDEDKEYSEMSSEYYWKQYGYEKIFTANGVSYETYKYYNLLSAYQNRYFEYIYGTDTSTGTNPLTEDEVKECVSENYTGLYALYADISNMDETAVEEQKAKYEAYKTRLQKGTPFSEIYIEANGQDAQEAEEGHDKYMQIVGSSDTSYYNEIWDTLKDMKDGEISVITGSSAIYLAIKKDISNNEHYLSELYGDVAYTLKGDEFNENLEAAAEDYEIKVIEKAIKQFKVEKINYNPET